MSETDSNQNILDYIQKNRFATLNYVREDLSPVSRTMGSFALDGFDLYFSTSRAAAKVKGINCNTRTSFFFEHDGQAPPEWKNVLLIASELFNISRRYAVYRCASFGCPLDCS